MDFPRKKLSTAGWAHARRGTLAVKSGYIVQQGPPGEAMRVRTPAAILGVRGTEFVVRAEAGR